MSARSAQAQAHLTGQASPSWKVEALREICVNPQARRLGASEDAVSLDDVGVVERDVAETRDDLHRDVSRVEVDRGEGCLLWVCKAGVCLGVEVYG